MTVSTTATTTTPPARLRTLATDQRVRVVESHDGVQLNALGIVARVRSDGGAWVRLDKAHQKYPATDDRGSRVMVYPENCELAIETKGNRAARRGSAKLAKAIAAQPTTVDIKQFGKDHWSTFAYITTIVMDGGSPARQRMRCDPKRHPLLAHRMGDASDGGRYPTRLKGDIELHNHDDWDCVADLETVGLVENLGSHINPMLRLTKLGAKIALQLTDHKQSGGNFAGFEPVLVSR